MSSKSRSIELDELVNAQCEGVLTDQQAARIEELLAGDAELRRDYIIYMHVHALAERGRGTAMDEIGSQVSAADTNAESAVSASPSAPVALPPSAFNEPSPQGFLGSAYHDTLSYFSSGWPVAYLVATVIFGFGLLIGSLVPVSQPEQVARQSVPLPLLFSPLSAMVGRITGIVDCKWEEGSGFRVQSPALDSSTLDLSSRSATSSPSPPA